MKFINLKVYTNKRTGQSTVVIPKKIMDKSSKNIKIPKEVKVKW